MKMNVQKYLERIGYNGALMPDSKTLFALQQAHLYTVPFENIDIQSRISISLDIQDVFEKVIDRKRGGYCYELNSLFCWLLTSIGYKVDMISAHVKCSAGFGAEYDHMALIVIADGKQWLTDVGFGNFSLLPLTLETDNEQFDGINTYRLQTAAYDGKNYYAVQKWVRGRSTFATEYLFSLVPCSLDDFVPMHKYQQTSPESHFTKSLMCSIATAGGGRYSVINNKLIITSDKGKKEIKIENDNQLKDIYFNYFGFKLFTRPIAV